jgi:hypothetical protein
MEAVIDPICRLIEREVHRQNIPYADVGPGQNEKSPQPTPSRSMTGGPVRVPEPP